MMLLTEEEAKTKWCPMVRARHERTELRGDNYVRIETHALNRIDDDVPWAATCCIASYCMMWRGALQRKSDGLIITHKTRVDARDYESVGCCGLAGKPEVT